MYFFLKLFVHFMTLLIASYATNEQVESEEATNESRVYLALFTQKDNTPTLDLDILSTSFKRDFETLKEEAKYHINNQNKEKKLMLEKDIESTQKIINDANINFNYAIGRKYQFNLIPFKEIIHQRQDPKSTYICLSTAEVETYSTVLPCYSSNFYFDLVDFVRDKKIIPSSQYLAEIVQFRLKDNSNLHSLVREVRQILKNTTIDDKYATIELFTLKDGIISQVKKSQEGLPYSEFSP